jgi:HK97 family phage major capsid protein
VAFFHMSLRAISTSDFWKMPTAALREELQRWSKTVGAPSADISSLDIDRTCWHFARWFAHAVLQNAELTDRPGGAVPVRRAAGTSPNSIGGSIVPDAATQIVIALRAQAGACRQNAQVVTMGSDSLPVPCRTAGLTVQFIGRNRPLPESQNVFDDVVFSARKCAAFMRMSSEINEDMTTDFGASILQEVANGFALFEDDARLNGDGTSTYFGMRGVTSLILDGSHNAGKVTAASGHNSFLLLDGTDLAKLMGQLPDYAWPGCKFYCSAYVRPRRSLVSVCSVVELS